jgi:hypothetical protein
MPAGSSRFDAVNQLDLLWDRLNCGSAGKRVPCFAAMLEKITCSLPVRRTIVSSNSASRILRPKSIKARRAKFRVEFYYHNGRCGFLRPVYVTAQVLQS